MSFLTEVLSYLIWMNKECELFLQYRTMNKGKKLIL